MLELGEDFLNEPGIDYFAFGRLNQDCIENLFALYRSKLGSNTHPSAREI